MIYIGFNNTGEVEAVYAAKRATTTGTPPLSFPSKGYDLEDFLISGNTVQDGTPTPEAPVDVAGCGVRTGNLFDKTTVIIGKRVVANGESIDERKAHSDYIDLSGINAISVSSDIGESTNIYFYSSKTNTADSYVRGRTASVPQGAKYCRVNMSVDDINTFMLNSGSTPLQYEPYGYKLPLTCGGIEYPIYLGQVETTRRIKKLVLTGKEVAFDSYVNNRARFTVSPSNILNSTDIISVVSDRYSNTYTVPQLNNDSVENAIAAYSKKIYIYTNGDYDIDTYKTYLAAQYSAGTPVTIWYVLAKPETGIVNEPLHKIGNYADIISLSQSGITVPTTVGTNTITTGTTVLPSSISITTPEKEVAEVYAGINYQNPVYYKNRTLTGTLPLMYKGLGQPLKDYNISGNTIQNGIPTPDAPVDVVGCGVRTGNLFDKDATDTANGYITDGFLRSDGSITTNAGYRTSEYIRISQKQSYNLYYSGVLNIPSVCFYDSEKKYISGIAYASRQYVSFTTPQNTVYLRLSFYAGEESSVMLNTGSTPLPYEPFGYKLPLTLNGTEYPIYLGQVETTRKIKKLVLTGDENWTYSASDTKKRVYFREIDFDRARVPLAFCSHFTHVINTDFISYPDAGYFQINTFSATQSIIFGISDMQVSDVSGWTQYLAAQYVTGTPVTVWYVLAESETAVVNEPLHKIGNYADTISFAQAGVTIPTVTGSNVLDMTSTVKPSAVSITGNIKPTGYGQLLDVNNVDIQDKNNTPIFIHS